MERKRKGGAEKRDKKKLALQADAVKCAKITDMFATAGLHHLPSLMTVVPVAVALNMLLNLRTDMSAVRLQSMSAYDLYEECMLATFKRNTFDTLELRIFQINIARPSVTQTISPRPPRLPTEGKRNDDDGDDDGHLQMAIMLKDDYFVRGAGLPGRFKAEKVEFHWGPSNGSEGSEHSINGRRYPVEVSTTY
ncbi:Receptor-type tyrosine-protein phosphatase gamma [Collichthys lucidus]|uniref:Receptor-type tyrosine-protein phosphatase gamma n=1 Tax=Collichthys lucidus TaxID=240159 RepID=A0A4U5UBQ8_COLLU|nr:Receptor-type tyrosine-protein phosphatase gamma [Collichthys lucidus]